MRRIFCLFLIFFAIASCFEVNAQKKKIRLHKLIAIQYDHTKIKDVLYDVSEKGFVLIDAKEIKNKPYDLLTKAVNSGEVQTRIVPLESAKILYLRRNGSVGRGFVMGAVGSFALTGLITAGSAMFGEGCGCGGPPAVLVLPPIAGLLGGIVGSVVGLAPKKTVRLDPERLYESANAGLRKYSLVGQLEQEYVAKK